MAARHIKTLLVTVDVLKDKREYLIPLTEKRRVVEFREEWSNNFQRQQENNVVNSFGRR